MATETIPYRSVMTQRVAEGATCLLYGTLKDERGALLPGSELTTLTLTLYEKSTKEILNSREDSNILQTGGGTVDNGGYLELELYAADNEIIKPRATSEVHVALIEYSYQGTKTGKHEIEFTVANLVKVPV